MELRFLITDIIHETPDTKTFYLAALNGKEIDYKPGQFLTFIFKDSGHEVRRSYSLGSTPGVDKNIFITVKRKTNGTISRNLFDHYKAGEELTAIEPSGKFTIEAPIAKRFIFIAAGVGITPVFGLIKQVLYFHPTSTVLLINQCRDEANIIYAPALNELLQKFPGRFSVTQLFSQPSSHEHFSKRVNNTWLEMVIKKQVSTHDTHDIQCYTCGPTLFMLMAQFTLKLLHFKDEQIHKEQFIIPNPPPAPLLQSREPRSVTITYKKREHHLQVAYPNSILDAALKQGIALPYSCKAGICSTCTAQCLDGKIVMSKNDVLTEKDINNGLTLTCTGYAETDAVLNFDINL